MALLGRASQNNEHVVIIMCSQPSENNEHCDIHNACVLNVISLEFLSYYLAVILKMLSTHTMFAASIDIPIVRTRRCLDWSIHYTMNSITAQYTPITHSITLPTRYRVCW